MVSWYLNLKKALKDFINHDHKYRFHLIVFSTLALLILSDFWIMERAIQDNRWITKVVNLNNRQRLLIQQIYNDATQLMICNNPNEAQNWRNSIRKANKQLAQNHQQLLHHNALLNSSTEIVQAIHHVFSSPPYQLTQALQTYMTLAQLLENTELILLEPNYKTYTKLVHYQEQQIKALDYLDTLYAKLASQKIYYSLWIERVIFTFLLALLIGFWLFIFRPLEHRLASERALQAQYQALFERSPSGIAVYQPIDNGQDFVFLDFNRSGEKMDHTPREAVLGKRVTEVFPGVEAFGLLAIFQAVYQDGKPRQHPISFYQDERLCGWRENYVYKLPSGEVVAIYEDVTPRKMAEKALQESEARFRSIFDYAPVGMALVDRQGYLILTNYALQSFLGYPHEELITKSFVELTHPKDADADLAQYHVLCAQKISSYSMDKRYIHKDGRIIWGHLTVSSVLEEEGQAATYSVGMVEDIGERKAAEAALRRSKAELEQRVIERTEDLQRINQDLQSSLEELKAAQEQLVEAEKMASLGGLVAGIAHEVNTPVGVGVTAASYLRTQVQVYYRKYQDNQLTRGDFEAFLHTADSSSDMILSNLKRAADLVRSFKQIAVDCSVEEKRTIKLKPYLDDILQSLQPRFKRTQHTVEIDCAKDLQVLTYPGALSQILTNLLINSLEHAFKDQVIGHIHIQVTLAAHLWLLEYRDDGCGIPPEHQRKIFEPFFTTRRNEGGTGLGMHIVYNLITQTLGGQIQCSSELGKGIYFRIQLPLLKE